MMVKSSRISKAFGSFVMSIFASGLSTLLRLFNALLIMKGIALYGTLNDMATSGSFLNLSQLMQFVATAGLGVGIVRQLSAHKSEPAKFDAYLANGLGITAIVSFATATLSILLSPFLSLWLFNSYHYWFLFVFLGVGVFLYGVNSFLLSYYTAIGNHTKFLKVSCLNALFGIVISLWLMWQFELIGALLSMALYLASGTMLFGAAELLSLWKRVNLKRRWFNPSLARELVSYAFFLIFNIVVYTTASLLIRSSIAVFDGGSAAGIWEAMNRLSAGYMTVAISVFMIYFMPRFSTTSAAESSRLIFREGLFLLLLLAITLMIVYNYRSIILPAVFADNYGEVGHLMPYFFVGDVFRLLGHLILLMFLAHRQIKKAIAIDVLWNGFFQIAAMFYGAKSSSGFQGIGLAYTAAYVLNAVFMMNLLFIYLKKVSKKNVGVHVAV
jgi:PST family polysaccharide transporter